MKAKRLIRKVGAILMIAISILGGIIGLIAFFASTPQYEEYWRGPEQGGSGLNPNLRMVEPTNWPLLGGSLLLLVACGIVAWVAYYKVLPRPQPAHFLDR